MTDGNRAGCGSAHGRDDEPSPLDHRAAETANALVVLQRSAYRVEAELLGSDRIPPLHESSQDVAALALNFLAIRRDGVLVAALAYRQSVGVLDIDRLMVHPGHFRQGLARRLVMAALASVPHERAVVSTGRENRPARALYASLGFEHLGDRKVMPGLDVSDYERQHDTRPRPPLISGSVISREIPWPVRALPDV